MKDFKYFHSLNLEDRVGYLYGVVNALDKNNEALELVLIVLSKKLGLDKQKMMELIKKAKEIKIEELEKNSNDIADELLQKIIKEELGDIEGISFED